MATHRENILSLAAKCGIRDSGDEKSVSILQLLGINVIGARI